MRRLFLAYVVVPEIQIPTVCTALPRRTHRAFSVCRNRKCRTNPSLYLTPREANSCSGLAREQTCDSRHSTMQAEKQEARSGEWERAFA